MPGGIQRTPFDTVDLGSQLLESLVAAQQTKDAKERMKLQEKQLGLQEKEMQLRAVQTADPNQPGLADILGQLLGAGGAVQPRRSVEEQQFAGLQDYLSKNPDIKEMHDRIQATGSVLPPGEALDAARIAAGVKLNVRDRISAYHDLLNQYGSPAAASLQGAYSKELGLGLPTGQTLGERQTAAQEKQARVAGSAAEAARIRAQQDSYEFVSGGFRPIPGSAAAQDPELYKKLVSEVVDFNLGRTNVISPEAASQIVPTKTWAAIMHAAASPSPQFATRLALYKEMLDFANKQKGKVSKEMLTQIQDLGQSLYDEALPPTPEGAPVPEGESGVSNFISSALGRMVGLATGTTADEITLSGRPLRPELREVLRFGLKGAGKIPGSPLAVFSVLEGSLSTLDKVYKKVLPLITTEPNKPPVVQPTVGALSAPEASAIPPEVKTKLQGLVQAYRNAGGTPEEAAAIESELLAVMKSGDEQAQKEYMQALLDDINSMKASGGLLEPRE